MELDIVKNIKKAKNVIATFNDGDNFVVFHELVNSSQSKELKKKLLDMDPKQLKKMIKNGDFECNETLQLIESTNKKKKYFNNEKTHFEYDKNDVMFMPELDKERDLIYIYGPSGSGKSYLTKIFVKLYQKYKKGNDVYILSHVENDPSFKGIKYKQIPIELEILENIDLETLNNSLIIFDDTATPGDKKLQDLIFALKDNIAQRGRHHNISAIYTTHLACNFKETRVLLNECNKFVIFPNSGGVNQQERMMCSYADMDKVTFKSLKYLGSRWVMFSNHYPNYIVYDCGVKLLT